MKVQAKFYVAETKRSAHAKGALTVTLQVVTRGEENKEWAAFTPSGQLTLVVKDGPAAEFFDRIGEDVLATFEIPEQ